MAKKKRLIMRTVILIGLSAAVIYALYTNLNRDKMNSIEINSKAPDFILTDMEGNKHKLSEYKGQGVFLNFWGTWCKPCETEMPFMDNQYQDYKEKGVQILAVNVGESDYAVKTFADKYKLSFPILNDKGGEVQSAYKVNPLPVTFLIDKDGKVIDEITGGLTEEDIKTLMERVKP
ncbi:MULTISPECIES: thiol-disulfide oxidoreductase ResA [Bacillaceae]|uniref:thiol-disulfide oxidoreductase ResA n=1 Tax=Bacillaceae TaxID=186817 RepID=UPI000C336B17|nr:MULTISPECIES: thiol-disulfide oxidoreductase ResA [Bacillaceae]MCK1981997.1 thiol-disulfide oxidoreductase ResA [Peribacillus sp. Aquil_B1]MCK2007651.1 thiol-disulfide oxidoreductase ResA [Peribacillus sp. Aquil_B8]PKF89074.1 thiol-disulfide oxidoreductase [Bacillus sp. BA3]